MVGLPRSGKSTWAKQQNLPIVNPDSIRLALHGERYIQLAEPFVWAIAKLMVRALFLAGHTEVILDATNTTRKARDNWLEPEWRTVFKEVNTWRGVCLERADEELKPVIERMCDTYEILEDDEEVLKLNPELICSKCGDDRWCKISGIGSVCSACGLPMGVIW